MITSPDYLRELKSGEEPQVEALLKLAFDGAQESQLVKMLRKDRAMAGEMVMAVNNQIVAYCALSKMVAPKGWLCLAPVAVHPDFQGRRTGKRMVGLITEWARITGNYLLVLGDVTFYERGGFSAARARNLTSPYPIDHTLLAGPGNDVPRQELLYPKAFGAL